MKTSCIIPAFNEEKTIVHVLRVVKQVSSIDEIIVVADGKSDACLFRACGLAVAYKPIQPLGDIQIEHMTQILIHAE